MQTLPQAQKTALLPLVEKAKKYSEDAHSDNTRKTYRSGWRSFEMFCRLQDLTPLPAAPGTVGIYLTAESLIGRSVATLRTRLAAIQAAHREMGHDNPVTDAVKRIMRGIARTTGTRQAQAAPITEATVQRILATIGNTAKDKRDLALVLAGRDLLARRSELVALDVADIQYAEDGSGTALISRSKTDQDGQGAEMYLSPRAVDALKSWLEMAKITDGAVFRRLWKGGRVAGRLTADAVPHIFRRLAKVAGVETVGISGHSCRVGMAQDLVASGAELPNLMQAGRWKSSAMPARYTERQGARRGAVARFYDGMEG
ncbi:MAG: site-specific integrase [Alphaproteobacteria bacterium]|jgi:integrase|nr:site-specific integrase [Alphaproteobacteria bacterium]